MIRWTTSINDICTLLTFNLEVLYFLKLFSHIFRRQHEHWNVTAWYASSFINSWTQRRFRSKEEKAVSIFFELHSVAKVLAYQEFAGNQGNHQNLGPSLLSFKCWLIFIEMKQKIFQNGRLKKQQLRFAKQPILKTFFAKILGIDTWVSRIDWSKGHWYGSIIWSWGCLT